MANPNSSFLDKVLYRIGRLDKEGLQTVIQRLARERRFLETLFNAIEDGVLVVDETGRVLYFNQAVTRLLGLQTRDAEGQLITAILPELDWAQLLASDSSGGQRIMRHEFEVSYPRPRYLSVYAAPLDGDAEGSSGLALIIHDATEARRKTFAAIETERIQALTLLAASVAHEIGNPLNALDIHVQLMEREIKKLRQGAPEAAPKKFERRRKEEARLPVLSEEALQRLERFLGVAKGEIVRLDYIVRQFLEAIRPSPPKLAPANLNDAVRETVDLLRPEIENRGIAVHEKLVRHLADSPFDAGQMKQVLVNLIKNALQAMTRGGILTLETGQTSEGVWVKVSDTGGGIPEDQINRIFEPFYTTKKKGSGLGLMIVQRIVRDHGGRIELESRLKQGTTFRIWLPLHEPAPRLLGQGETGTNG
ncbi:MAG: ATP-binding protein [Verrucomicrobia subdivision 3 bacterium]|nr:ATP-binding protein [Limisphaerales bacterium]